MGMTGEMIEVIQNMYSKAKSVVSFQGITSSSFSCNKGVRQARRKSVSTVILYLLSRLKNVFG